MTQAVALLAQPTGRIGRRAVRQLRKLTRDRTRRRVAAGLVRAVADAYEPRPWTSARIPVDRRKVIACRDELLELAERLQAPGPVYSQGVALATALLSDGGGPLYQSGGDLHTAVENAFLALDGHLE